LSQSSVIALLTDLGMDDVYVGIMKGVILSKCPNARVVDLIHSIPPQDVRSAAYHLLVSYKYFPVGTVFVCVVDPGVGSKRQVLAIKTDRYTFLAPDNGLLSREFPTPFQQQSRRGH